VKIKVDECLHHSIAVRLRAVGYDADSVRDENLEGRPDSIIWAAAFYEQRMLITVDLDFSDARAYVPGTHPGIFIVRLPQAEQRNTPDYVLSWFADRAVVESWAGCFVVATEKKIRVRRPST
jgi:predicted nuclease of predicted toxin-antitoxin system